MSDPRAIVDFEDPGADGRLAFAEPVVEFRAEAPADVADVVEAAEAAAADGAWVVGFMAYEAAAGLDGALAVRAGCRAPLAWFGVFGEPERSPRPDRVPCFARTGGAAVPEGWSSSETRATHAATVLRIRDAIARGDVYQVNHTFRLRRSLDEPPLALYERLVRTVPAPYAAYLRVPPLHVVSISPELFFRRRARRLTTRPMKGTAPRGRWPDEDRDLARALAASEKDRAENLMIVDLLRNDLGRVATVGSVAVRDLFRVERYPTVHQMTSTVCADARPEASLLDVLRALFPCGSVTGAPKIAATRWIAALESTPREVYCGAVGLIRPGGDCVFSVAIRTALADDSDGGITYGVGGGITWASTAAGEWEEALEKAAVLNDAAPAGDLIETFRAEAGVAVRWPEHRRRLASSAAVLGHRCEEVELDRAVAAALRDHPDGPVVARLTLATDGGVSVAARPQPARTPLCARAAAASVDSHDPRLFHKTSDRSLYAVFRSGMADNEEVLLWNERAEATEFTRGNLVIELDGRAVTPPLNAGLLPGVFRDELVRSGAVAEAVVRLADVDRASAVWFVNSARGWVPVRWNPAAEPGVAP